MTPAYQMFIEQKLNRTEFNLEYAIKRLRQIISDYDLPFLSDDHRRMMTELSRLKLYLEHAKNPQNANNNH